MENVIKNRPAIGDIVILVDGKKRFVRGAEATKAFIDTQQAIGVVYDVQGNYVRMVGGVNTTSKQWSCVADYEITAIPASSGAYAVTLNSAVVGDFTYTRSDGSIAEFAAQLSAWLSTNSPKWEAYSDNEHSYLQMKTYDVSEGGVSISGATLVKLIGSELATYTESYCRNAVKQKTVYNGMCRARMEAYVINNVDSNCNPTTEMNGTSQLFITFPCSQAYYDGGLGSKLRANFATYSLYLDACMVRYRELNNGIMQYRDGKLMTSLLSSKIVKKAGVDTYAYEAAHYAITYDTDIAGFGSGAWWLPSMYELALLMRGIGDSINAVNVALSKKTGWSAISNTSNRWSVCRYVSGYAWDYNNVGICYFDNFYYGFAVSAVSAFELED